MSEWPSNHADLVVADPPYNLGKEYGNGSDSLLRDDYLKFTGKWLSQAIRILKPTGFSVRVHGFSLHFASSCCLTSTFTCVLMDGFAGITRKEWGENGGFRLAMMTFFSSPRRDQFTFNLDSVRVPQKFYRSRNNMRGANPGDVWEFSHVHYCQGNRTKHPTQKPEGLIERIVLASSNENDIVVDPFAGSGTTLRVCQQLDRRSIGIELSSEYVSLIESRLKDLFYWLRHYRLAHEKDSQRP